MFCTPTHTAAAAYVIAGMFDRENQASCPPSPQITAATAPLSGSGAGTGTGAGGGAMVTALSSRTERQAVQRQDRVISRDILIGELVPVVRLAHLAGLPRADSAVVIVDVRDCTALEHNIFTSELRRSFPSCHVLHCPGYLLQEVQLVDSEDPVDRDGEDAAFGSLAGITSSSPGRRGSGKVCLPAVFIVV